VAAMEVGRVLERDTGVDPRRLGDLAGDELQSDR